MRINNKIFGGRGKVNAKSDCAHCMRIRRLILKSIVTVGAALFGSSVISSHAATQIKARVKKPIGTRPVRTKKEWLKADPLTRGPGLGIIIHEKARGLWVVAHVLRGSPAARAGIRKGDRIKSINKYSYKSGNLLRLIHAVRRNKSRKHTVEVMRPGRKTAIFSVGSASMTRMIDMNWRPIQTGLFCVGCTPCFNWAFGYARCDCQTPCAVV